MKKFLSLLIVAVLTLQIKAQTITDADGNTYNTVTIGTQVWMKENLKTTKYKDGTVIPYITDNIAWNDTTPAYCWYNNDAATYKSGRGGLYNWYTIKTTKLCPTGWHVPSNDEWITLVDFLGGSTVAGPKMREVGNTYYVNNAGATNSSGLSLRATGVRFDDGSFTGITFWGGWWSTSDKNFIKNAVLLNVDNNYLGIGGYDSKKWGLAIRCLKDIPTSLGTSNPVAGIVIYPNPVSNMLIIDNVAHKSVISIISMGGKLFMTTIATNPHTEIPVSDLPAGIYFLRVNGSTSKFVKL